MSAFAGLLGAGLRTEPLFGKLTRAGGKWYFVSQGAWSSLPIEYRWVFDTSAEYAPEEGPAALYTGLGSDALAVVVQRGKAVGWFRADQPATTKQVAGLRRRRKS